MPGKRNAAELIDFTIRHCIVYAQGSADIPAGPRIEPKVEALIVQMAKENSGWGYDRIVGALANLGYARKVGTVS